VQIDSDSKIPIENHFKIFAGPGAGKTFWLVNHIKDVLQNSTRLLQTRKIACITYTNIGVETILKRLGTAVSQVEVSTIHSFLYRHVVKPYCNLLTAEYMLDIEKFKGYDDTYVSFRKVKEWLENHPHANELKSPFTVNQLIKLPQNIDVLRKWLESLHYRFNENGDLIIVGDRSKYFSRKYLTGIPYECLDILEPDLLSYKKLYWQDGSVDHNDILFFSYKLIEKHPFILTILRAKFPYFFVDEFQDTNPIQINILKQISKEETIVGIIGDPIQSIYEFQGAGPRQFIDFSLPGLKNYTMKDNRRSTNQIIDVLNSVRTDIKQKKYRKENADTPIIIVGERNKAYSLAKQFTNNEDLYSLSRKNITSNLMKKEIDNILVNENIFAELADRDGSSDRRRMVLSSIKAVELANNGKYKEAIKKLEYLFRKKDEEKKTSKAVLNCLVILLNDYELYKDKPLIEFYKVLKTKINKSLTRLTGGAVKRFYETKLYQDFAICVDIVDDQSLHKTIHKAKGDEFNNVILITEESKLDFLWEPNFIENEEHRIYYVAISRAKERLYINVPKLSDITADKLRRMFKIEKV